jgi:hypothetical protein
MTTPQIIALSILVLLTLGAVACVAAWVCLKDHDDDDSGYGF